ncbi:MAG: NlpC/P60 family protein [Ruminococcaceae bacterium]|nr:NlpC/P60 family protein [Oscillospiraceae bacterium]
MKSTKQLQKRIVAIVLAMVTVFGVGSFAYADEMRNAKVTGNGVNLRQEANTDSTILTNIAADTAVAVIGEEENGWYRVSYENKIGYMAADYVEPAAEEAAEPVIGYVTGSYVYVRSAPTTDSEILGGLSRRTQVTLREEIDGWYLVESETLTGYMSAEYIGVGDYVFSAGDDIVDIAKRYLGYRYVYGGTTPSTGFDCSGLVTWVYKQYNGYTFSCRTALYRDGARVSSYSELQPGDLVFFRTAGNGSISHVGIYVGDGQFIHAPNSRSVVKISSMAPGSYYYRTYCGARRIF